MNTRTDIRPAEAEAAGQLVQTRLGPLYVTQRGQGEAAIVLWPSIFTDHHIYDALTERLGDRYRFYLIDGPAHGQSAGVPHEFSMQDCAEAFLSVMDHFGLQSAVVGGTSWGGLVAAELALAAPDRAQALILMNTPMEIDGSRPTLSARMIAAGARWVGNRAFFQNGVAKSFFSPQTLARNQAYRDRFHAMLRAADQTTLAAAIRSVILRGAPLKPRMAALSVPTLVIAGTEDAMYPITTQEAAAKQAPQGSFAAVPGKHISVVEAPADVAKTITRFMGEVATDR
ncbi:MAG: alpha/beta hydrolase [Pseudomonadota bacterium]